jgi:glutamate-1-semialdehyde 2,1-aminomutase
MQTSRIHDLTSSFGDRASTLKKIFNWRTRSMKKNTKTREWVERSKNALAQGSPATNSKRWSQYVNGVYPSHTRGFGYQCYLEDAWGHKYVDFISALGALSLGYTNARVEDAVIRQIKKGAAHSLPTTLEVELAEILASLIPEGERWRFFKNGKDAAECAIRASRAYTGKQWVLSDGYHGCSDIFTSLTPPSLGIKDIHHIEGMEEPIDWDDTACVIVEAIKLSDGKEYQEWIRNIRQKCKEHNVIFIVDEIVTGFRVPRITVSNWWSLDPDLILLGKGMANGYPLSALGGRKEILDATEYFYSTTFGGEAVSLAASKAVVEEINHRNLEDLMFYGKRLQLKLNELHKEIRFDGYGTRAMFNITNPTAALFAQEMVRAGFLFGKAFFFNFSHLEANIEELVISSAKSVMDRIQSGSVKLEGDMPQESFKR